MRNARDVKTTVETSAATTTTAAIAGVAAAVVVVAVVVFIDISYACGPRPAQLPFCL